MFIIFTNTDWISYPCGSGGDGHWERLQVIQTSSGSSLGPTLLTPQQKTACPSLSPKYGGSFAGKNHGKKTQHLGDLSHHLVGIQLAKTRIKSGWWFQPLWKMWKSVGMIIPNIWENQKGLKPPTSIGSCFCVEFVLHCRGFCLHLWMYFAKESDFQVELENRQEGIPVYQETWGINQTKKRTSNIHATKTLHWIHSVHSLPEFPMFFPAIFPKKMTKWPAFTGVRGFAFTFGTDLI